MRRAWLVVGLAVLLALGGAAFHFRYLLFSQLHVTAGEDPAGLGLRRVADVPLAGGADRFDYQAIDPQRGLLWVTHLGSDQVVAFDLAAGTVRGYVDGVSSPHGVTVDPGRGRAYVSATGSHQVVAIDEDRLAVVARIGAGSFPDGLAFDPASQRLFVSDESGGKVVVIDTISNRLVQAIDLGGEAGNTQFDAGGHQVIAAAQGRGQLAFIDPFRGTVTSWVDVPGCAGPHGFYVDSPVRRAYVSCEQNAALVVMDLDAKKPVATFGVGDVPDVLAFDPGLGRLYAASESGVVATFHTGNGTLEKLGQEYLAPAAHTVAVDAATHRVYVPLEDVGGKPVLRILEPT